MMQLYKYLFALFLLLFAGCAAPPRTAVEYVSGNATANANFIATAQVDQYQRDAQATLTARDATQQAIAIEIRSTSEASTATASAQQTQDALVYAMTVDAVTRESQARETSTAQANVLATATAQAQATEQTILATRQAFELAQEQAKARRENIITIATSVLLILAGVVAFALVVLFFFKAIPILVGRLGLVHYGQHKNPLLLTTKGNQTVLADPMRMLQSALTIDEKGSVSMPKLTPDELQLIVTGGALRTLVEQARNAPGHPPMLPSQVSTRRKIGSYENFEEKRYELPHVIQNSNVGDSRGLQDSFETPSLPSFIPWNVLHSNGSGGLVLGMGHENIIVIDPAKTPHILLSGSSGAGKTRRALRPLVAQALAQSVVVALLNESGADFSPFYDHPNAFVIRGTPSTYINFLANVIREMERREAVLRNARVSEWGRLPDYLADGPPALVVIDEVLSLAMTMTPIEQRQFWSLLATYASRARKLSMGSIGALTDPTYRILGPGLNWREQCSARISFRVSKSNISRAVLDSGGAETLEEGQFLAMLGSGELVKGVSANPTDAELKTYLSQSPVRPVIGQDWLLLTDGTEPVRTGSEPLRTALFEEEPVPNFRIPISHERAPTLEERQYMRFLHHQDGMSKNAICRMMYGFKNGQTYAWVTEAVES
jgi:hypothetical protein